MLRELIGLVPSIGAVEVLDGAQVLSLSPTLSPATTEQFSSSSSPSRVRATLAALVAQPIAMAKSLAAHLSGQSASGTYYELPPGGVDPCLMSPGRLGSKLGTTVTASFQLGDGDTECAYDVGEASYTLSVETDAEAAFDLPPTSVASRYATAANGSRGTSVQPVRGDSAQAFVTGAQPQGGFASGLLLTSQDADQSYAAFQAAMDSEIAGPDEEQQNARTEQDDDLERYQQEVEFREALDIYLSELVGSSSPPTSRDECESFWTQIGDSLKNMDLPGSQDYLIDQAVQSNISSCEQQFEAEGQ
jgi:hypothetical protein